MAISSRRFGRGGKKIHMFEAIAQADLEGGLDRTRRRTEPSSMENTAKFSY